MLQNDIKTRLHTVRKMLNMKQVDVANILGIGQNAYSMIENGKTKLSSRNRTILEKQLRVNPNFLLNGDEPILLKPTQEQYNTSSTPTNTIKSTHTPPQTNGIPYISQTPTSTTTTLHSLANTEPEYYIDIKPLSDCHFYRSVTTQNMSPRYNPGDIIACRLITDISDTMLIGNNFLFVISTTNGRYETIAKLRKSSEEGKVLLEHINTSYDPYNVSICDILESYLICGKIERSL